MLRGPMRKLGDALLLLSLSWCAACDEPSQSTTASGSGGAASSTSEASSTASASATSASTGGATDPHYGCVGEVDWPVVPAGELKFELTFADEYDKTLKLAGAGIKLCPRDDLHCANPFATGVTNPQGEVLLTAQLASGTQGWSGYVEVAAGPDYPLNLIVFTRPAGNDPHIDFGVIGQEDMEQGVELVTNAPADPGRGAIAMTVYDCAHEKASGATITATPLDTGTIGYGVANIPLPDKSATDKGGLAVVANATPGYVTITSTSSSGETMAVAAVPVRAGAITTFGLDPTPLP